MAVLGHIAANLAAVLRTETGWLDFSFYPTVKGILFTIVMAAAGIGVVCVIAAIYRKSYETGKDIHSDNSHTIPQKHLK